PKRRSAKAAHPSAPRPPWPKRWANFWSRTRRTRRAEFPHPPPLSRRGERGDEIVLPSPITMGEGLGVRERRAAAIIAPANRAARGASVPGHPIRIGPSILSADFLRLGEQIAAAQAAG